MQRIHAHLPAAIRHLRWAYLSLAALLASLVSTKAHAAVRPAQESPDLHSSRDGVLSRLAARITVTSRQHPDRAMALHRVRAGESMSADALAYCHGQARDWTGIYAASWLLLFVNPWFHLAAQAVVALVLWWATFGPATR